MSGFPPGPVYGGIVCGRGGLCVVVHIFSQGVIIIDPGYIYGSPHTNHPYHTLFHHTQARGVTQTCYFRAGLGPEGP
jgi:hypothetical protein